MDRLGAVHGGQVEEPQLGFLLQARDDLQRVGDGLEGRGVLGDDALGVGVEEQGARSRLEDGLVARCGFARVALRGFDGRGGGPRRYPGWPPSCLNELFLLLHQGLREVR